MAQLAPPRVLGSGDWKMLSQPWFSSELKRLQRNYRRQERRWKLNPVPEQKVVLKSALRAYKGARFSAKSKYYTTKVKEAENAPRELFNMINTLSTPLRPRDLENSQEFCDKVSEYMLPLTLM
ncbi:hypothetical protein NDU88_004115 [Pleurodeles waltl]|uniref:Uncharacterized protein n=1 Tax=Pleurodeles waltl TaxID=8319 RepID=A0AAV7W4D1_PLEWA|nr:hypothetical protein NDU88_004115 [Pleurodeles waltl]